jgi:hypothetical protein
MTEPGQDIAVSSSLYRVAVRMPPFWPDRPALWLAQVEVQFELAGFTSQTTKFNQVVYHLQQQHAAEVEDIITTPPQDNPYDRLKAELVKRLSTSGEQRVRQLLSHEEMEDRKPSQFLRHYKGLAPDVPADYRRTCRPYLTGRKRAAWTRLPTSQIGSARSHRYTPRPLSALRRPKTRPDCGNASTK